jgi:AcrR family transcriptional regulator
MSKGTVTRDRIIATALRAASVEGIEGITLGKIATDMGMSKSGLFAHFDSKEELQLDVIAAAVAKFTDVVVRPALAAPRGEARVRALFERWLEWERHESVPGGCIFVHAAVELDDRPGPARDAVKASQRQWLDTLAKAARMAIDVGHFRDDLDADLFAFQTYGIVLGYYMHRRLLGDPNAGLRVRQSFDTLVEGARRPRAGAASP